MWLKCDNILSVICGTWNKDKEQVFNTNHLYSCIRSKVMFTVYQI